MTLRVSVHSAIIQTVQDSETFVPTDFDLKSEGTPTGTKLRLAYRFADSYFSAVFPNKQTRAQDGRVFHAITLSYRPGRLNLTETGTADGEESLLFEIKDWLARLRKDLLASPLGRQLEEQEAALQDIYKRIGIEDDEELDEDDRGSLIDRIRDLESRMAENIAAHEQHKTRTDWRIAQLREQVDALIVIVSAQKTKKGAIRALLGRVFAWAAKEENQKLLQDVGSTVAGLLASGK